MKIKNIYIKNSNVSFGGLFNVVSKDFIINESCLKENKISNESEIYHYQKNNLDVVAQFIKSDEIIVRKDFIVNRKSLDAVSIN